MIQTDGRDHRKHRMGNCIGSVKPSAKPCLQDNIFYVGFLKHLHPHSKEKFKIGRMPKTLRFHFCRRVINLPEDPVKGAVVHRLPADLDPFVDGYKMRGCKEPRLLPLCHQYRLDIGADRTLSIGACHMYDFPVFCRVPQPF